MLQVALGSSTAVKILLHLPQSCFLFKPENNLFPDFTQEVLVALIFYEVLLVSLCPAILARSPCSPKRRPSVGGGTTAKTGK